MSRSFILLNNLRPGTRCLLLTGVAFLVGVVAGMGTALWGKHKAEPDIMPEWLSFWEACMTADGIYLHERPEVGMGAMLCVVSPYTPLFEERVLNAENAPHGFGSFERALVDMGYAWGRLAKQYNAMGDSNKAQRCFEKAREFFLRAGPHPWAIQPITNEATLYESVQKWDEAHKDSFE